MDAWDAVVSRRNVRDFRKDPIPPEDLDRILEAARRTPSSRNGQPWDFVVVTEVADQDLASELLGFPADRFCAAILSLGYPGDRPLSPIRSIDRRPFDEVVHRERW
jgi:nitroreductase